MANYQLRIGPVHNRREDREILYLDTFKSAVGYLRILEVILCICCIAAVSSWNMELDYSCRNETSAVRLHQNRFTTFHLSGVKFQGCDGEQRTLWHINDDATPNVRFFYIVSITGLIFSTFISITYMFFWRKYTSKDIYLISDLLISVVMTVMYLVCSCVWWGGANIVGAATSEDNMRQLFTENAGFWDLKADGMYFQRDVNNWVLTVSVLLNWCLFLLNGASFLNILKDLWGLIYPT